MESRKKRAGDEQEDEGNEEEEEKRHKKTREMERVKERSWQSRGSDQERVAKIRAELISLTSLPEIHHFLPLRMKVSPDRWIEL